MILAFLALIPASKHFHLVLSPITVFLKSPVLGTVPNLDFEKEEVGLERVKDLGSKIVLDALTCVECGRCQVNCPAWGAGKELNPKTIVLQTQEALLEGSRDKTLVEVYTDKVLWQCTTCGACENQCPVGIEHLPLLIGSRRGLVSNGEAPGYLGGVYNHLERRGNIWGLGYDQRQKFIDAAGIEIFDPCAIRCSSGSGVPARSRPTTRTPCARSSRSCAPGASRSECSRKNAAHGIRPSGPATNTCFRSLPTANIEDVGVGRAEDDPDVVSSLCEDDRRRLQAVWLRSEDRALGCLSSTSCCGT